MPERRTRRDSSPAGGPGRTGQRFDPRALAASPDQLAQILTAVGEGIHVLDTAGRTVFQNPAAEAALGWPSADLVGQVSHARVHHHHADGRPYPVDECPIQRTLVDGVVRHVDDEVFFRADGSSFPVEYVCAPVRGADGEVAGAVVSFRDVSEQRRAARELARSEERFRILARATNDAIWDWDLATNDVWWNEGFENLFGFRRDEVEPTAESWYSRIHPDDRNRVMSAIHDVIDGRSDTWSDEYRFLRKDGSHAYVVDRGHVIRDAAGRAVRMVGGMTDLTERRRFEERLAEQAALLDAAHEAIYVTDMEDRVVYWNKGAERVYGWTASDAMGRSVADLLHSDLHAFAEARRQLLGRGEWHGEVLKRTRDGREVTVDVRWTLVRDGQGRPKSILAINTDVTDRRKFESRLLRTQRLESLGTLAGGVAHDLNNVLAPIITALDLLRDEIRDAEARELVDTLQNSAHRGAALIRQLLSFGREPEGRREDVQLFELAGEIRNVIRDTFPKNIRFVLRHDDELWTVRGDPTQLYQVLMNLCVNARDAMPAGGDLTLTLANRTLDDLYAGMNPDASPGPYVVIRIEDTGTGIPQDIQERIFDPFFTTKELGRGTGLGLSTVLAIVRGHGGFVNVYSEMGKGSRFKVYLPARAGADAIERVTIAQTGFPRGNGELILVVDDEEAVRIVCQKTLERYGYRVVPAANGAEAVSIYAQRREEIALVLTDIAMPIMDGPATIVALRAINPGIRIVASSGHAANGGLSRAMGVGVRHFVPKPYTAEALLRTLRLALTEGEPV